MTICVEAVYALPRCCHRARLKLADGATMADATAAALNHPAFAGLELNPRQAGIFGQLAPPETLLREGDRVEFYRPLARDPMARRRALAANPTRSGP